MVRQLFGRCIDLGRQFARTNDKKDFHEALRLLGTACHCLEDYSAHSNYTELALIEMGERQVFPHVGSRTQIRLEGARSSVYPIITGTFGGTDFLHSVMGEFTDKATQFELDELENTMKQAQNADTSLLKELLDKLPSGLFGGDDKKAQADQLQANAQAAQMENMHISPKDPEEFTQQMEQITKQIYPLFEFHDNIIMSISETIDKIPILPDIIEQVQEQVSIFVFSLMAPIVMPIVNQVKSELKTGSSEIIQSSKNQQLNVFQDDNCTDPTHSMLSKDHFSNILNEPAGKIAGAVLKWVVPQIVSCWDNENIDARRTIDRIVNGVFHHPALRDYGNDGAADGRRAMFEVVERWWQDKDEREKDDLRQKLSRDGVEQGRNHKEGVHDGGHGCGKPLGLPNARPQGSSSGGAVSGVLGALSGSSGHGGQSNQHAEKIGDAVGDAVGGGALGSLVGGLAGAVGGGVLGGIFGGKKDEENESNHGSTYQQSSSYGQTAHGSTGSYSHTQPSGGYGQTAAYGQTSSYGQSTGEYGRTSSYDQSSSAYGQPSSHAQTSSHNQSSGGYGQTSSHSQSTTEYGQPQEGYQSSESYHQSGGRNNQSQQYGDSARQGYQQEISYGGRDESRTSHGGQQSQYGRNNNDSDDDSDSNDDDDWEKKQRKQRKKEEKRRRKQQEEGHGHRRSGSRERDHTQHGSGYAQPDEYTQQQSSYSTESRGDSRSSYGQEARQSYGQQEGNQYGRQDTRQSYGQQDADAYGRQESRQSYGQQSGDSYGREESRQSYGQQSGGVYGRQEETSRSYGGRNDGGYGTQDDNGGDNYRQRSNRDDETGEGYGGRSETMPGGYGNESNYEGGYEANSGYGERRGY